MRNSSVGGDIQIINSESYSDVRHSDVGADIQLDNNQGATYRVFLNTVSGSIQVDRNTVAGTFSSRALIDGNTVGGNLQCARNTPPPDASLSGSNTVTGLIQGQCSGL